MRNAECANAECGMRGWRLGASGGKKRNGIWRVLGPDAIWRACGGWDASGGVFFAGLLGGGLGLGRGGAFGGGFAFFLFAHDPDFDFGSEVGGELDGDRIGVDAAERFVEADVVRLDGVAEFLEFVGDVAFADGTEEVSFLVGGAGEGDFDALEGGDEFFFLLADEFDLGFVLFGAASRRLILPWVGSTASPLGRR